MSFGEDGESDGWLSQPGEDSFGFGEGEDASLYSGESYSLYSEEGDEHEVEQMHVFLGEGESVEYEDSEDSVSFSEEDGSYSFSEDSEG